MADLYTMNREEFKRLYSKGEAWFAELRGDPDGVSPIKMGVKD
jgi:hypothetical protein